MRGDIPVCILQANLTKSELQATVTSADFAAAAAEVKPSVSMKELDYYHSLRKQFSAADPTVKQ